MIITVLGNGSIGRRHLKGLLGLKSEIGISELRGFDTNPARRDQVRKEVPGVCCAESLEDALAGADIVFLCVPTALHLPIYEQCKAHGNFHFFIEKPLSHSMVGCEKMLWEQRQVGKRTAVGYMLYFHPLLKRAQQLLSQGVIGRPLSVRAEAGFFLPNWHPWEDYRDFYMSWKMGGGGALLDISHEIDYLHDLFGDIEDVRGWLGTVSDLEISSDDLAVAMFKFKSGLVGQLQLDLLQPEESRFCKVIGTKGVLIFDLTDNSIRYNTTDDVEWVTESLEVNIDMIYADEYRGTISALMGGGQSYVSGERGYKTMQVVEAIRRSSSYGVKVTLPLYD